MSYRPGTVAHQTLYLLIAGVGLVLISVAAFLALPRAQVEVQQAGISAVPIPVNFPAPEVKLIDLNGKPVALSGYNGQIILYNAWATWCPPCKDEMPILQKYYEEHQKNGFVVVAIEDGEPTAEVEKFANDYNLTFPIWPDQKWVATTAFKTSSLPTSFVIDRTGTVRLTWTGAISRDMLEKYVTPLILEQ